MAVSAEADLPGSLYCWCTEQRAAGEQKAVIQDLYQTFNPPKKVSHTENGREF